MIGALATNPQRDLPTFHSNLGATVNRSIAVAGIALWRLEALKKVGRFAALPFNWDSHESAAPSIAVRQTALDLILRVPSDDLPAPAVVPISGGGIHLEWAVDERELEISIEPSGRVDALRVEDGVPVEDDPDRGDIDALFTWLVHQ